MNQLIKQPTAMPTRKVTATAVVGAPSAAVILWVVNALILPALSTGPEPITMPVEVAAALGSLIAFAAGYFAKDSV